MNKNALKQIAEQLADHSCPAQGLSQLLLNELVDVQAGMPGRLTPVERVCIAEALKLQLGAIERMSYALVDDLDDVEA